MDLSLLENVIRVGQMLDTRARDFRNEREWEEYLLGNGIAPENDLSYKPINRPPDTMQVWDTGGSRFREKYVRKYLVIPREFAEKALILKGIP
jgi:hypothetical protein